MNMPLNIYLGAPVLDWLHFCNSVTLLINVSRHNQQVHVSHSSYSYNTTSFHLIAVVCNTHIWSQTNEWHCVCENVIHLEGNPLARDNAFSLEFHTVPARGKCSRLLTLFYIVSSSRHTQKNHNIANRFFVTFVNRIMLTANTYGAL